MTPFYPTQNMYFSQHPQMQQMQYYSHQLHYPNPHNMKSNGQTPNNNVTSKQQPMPPTQTGPPPQNSQQHPLYQQQIQPPGAANGRNNMLSASNGPPALTPKPDNAR